MCSLSGVSFFLCFPFVLLTLQADGRDDGGPGLPIGQSISAVKRGQNNAAQNNGRHRADGAKPISEAGLEPVVQKNSAIVPIRERCQSLESHEAGDG